MTSKIIKNPILWILVASPLFLWAIILLLPTYDDWGYFTTPYYDFGGGFTSRLVPRSTYWRPWDCIFGYVLSLKPSLFPALNHIAVYLAHVGCCVFVYHIGKLLKFNLVARNISTLFFFISPAMLGTVLGIDSLNQAYSELWGLAATWLYLRRRDRMHTFLWLLAAVVATFAKENGIVFFVIPQILAWGFSRITLRQAVRDTAWAALCIAVYFFARIMLNNPEVYVEEEYLENTLSRKLKNIGVFIGMTWIPLDYVCLICKPCRNLLVVGVTLALGMPFIVYLLGRQRKYIFSKPAASVVICLLAAASPHLATVFTAMHSYAGLGMASLLVAYLMDKYTGDRRIVVALFAMFFVNCLFVDWHHWAKSYQSGLTGRNMACQAVEKAKSCPKNVYIIYLEQGETKYSSFCVIPNDAFGWGTAVKFKTRLRWPKNIEYQVVNDNSSATIHSCMSAAKAYDGVWYIHGDTVDVLR